MICVALDVQYGGRTALHCAAYGGHTSTVVKALMTAGANVNAADEVRVWYEYNYS